MDPGNGIVIGPGVMAHKEVKPMTRPGFATVGRKIKLTTNFFHLTVPPKLIISQYAISIWRLKNPDEDKNIKTRILPRPSSDHASSRKVLTDVSPSEVISYNRAVFAQVCERYGDSFGCKLAYDGRSIAYAPREVNRTCLGVMYSIIAGSEGGPPKIQETREGRTEKVQLKIEHTKYLKYEDIFGSGPSRMESSATTPYLAGLDVVLGLAAVDTYVQIGRSFYSSDGARSLDSAVSAWRGFYQSVRLSQLGLVVNLDESYSAFWNHGRRPLLDLINDVIGNRSLSCNNAGMLKEITKALKSLKVRANHTGISYRVYGFSSKNADNITFESCELGREVSVADYFAEHYRIILCYKNFPCVRTHPKRSTFLPIEVLTVVENQRCSGALSHKQAQSMVRIASSKPNARKEAARKTMERLKFSSETVGREFDLRVKKDLVRVEGRVLPAPMICYRGRYAKPTNGTWNQHDHARKEYMSFPRPFELNNWAVINMTAGKGSLSRGILKEVIRGLVTAAKNAGMPVASPKPSVSLIHEDDIARELRVVARRLQKNNKLTLHRIDLPIIVIIKPNKDARVYNLIKRVADTELGILTQVLLQTNCRAGGKGREQFYHNVILKINAKLGGQNMNVAAYPLPQPGSKQKHLSVPNPNFLGAPYIILGADVSHPDARGGLPSVAALVGSKDPQAIQYSVSVSNQEGRKEVIEKIGEMFKDVYDKWRENCHKQAHTKAIVMFRDGVSEGQFEEVMQVEVAALRRACMEIDPSLRPLITYIIVTKRHHARFFGQKPDLDKSGNVVVGTAVDTGITSRDYFDFYILSHTGIQGTSKPSKYTVLIDENKMSVNAMQGFVFKLAHTYMRCNRSVSMVSSVYYAHLMAFRGRAYLEGENPGISQRPPEASSIPAARKIPPHLSSRLFFV